MTNPERTPWQKILTYDADITMITDARGRGKTFGMRQQFLKDWLQNHHTFVQIVRHEYRIPEISNGYFDALSKPIDNKGTPASPLLHNKHIRFKRRGHDMLAAIIPHDQWNNPDYTPKWERIGYFVSLSKAQDYKELTFRDVRRLCLDEALIQNPNGHHNYLPLEFEQLISIVDSTTREQPGQKQHKPNIYLLSNACSIVNPYFQHYGIDHIPPDGFSWWGGKTFLLYVGHDLQYADEKARHTVAGRMSRQTETAGIANNNQFMNARLDLVQQKTSQAVFTYAMAYQGQKYGIWTDLNQGLYYITQRIPKDAAPIYALTTSDNRLNYLIATRSTPQIQSLLDMYSLGLVRFDTPATREQVENGIFRLYGLR